MFRSNPAPDYRRFLDAIWRREPDRVPIAELGVDPPVKAKFLGRPVHDVKTDVEFWWRAGYDYISLRPAYEFPHTMPGSMTTGTPRYGNDEVPEEKSVSVMGPGVISSFKDMDSYPWPEPETDAYYAPLIEAAACLPPGMGLVSGVGGIFMRTWMLFGFEKFCFALAEQPELVARRFPTGRQHPTRRAAKSRTDEEIVRSGTATIWPTRSRLMVSPQVYRKYLFPWMEEMASIAHAVEHAVYLSF